MSRHAQLCGVRCSTSLRVVTWNMCPHVQKSERIKKIVEENKFGKFDTYRNRLDPSSDTNRTWDRVRPSPDGGDSGTQSGQTVDKERFIAFVTETEKRLDSVRDNIMDILKQMDTDDNGTISVRELKECVTENPGIFLSLLGL